MTRSPESGQLLFPMLTALFLFGMFFIAYALWCRHTYWRMRMDMAADATALSAMREEAGMLNTIGTMQYLENTILQKAKLRGEDVAGVQVPRVNAFNNFNAILKLYVNQYASNAYAVASRVAKANGADVVPIPIPYPQHHLVGQNFFVHYLVYGVMPTGAGRIYRPVYYARDWWPNETAPQPIHRETWIVCHDGICEKGKARLWLDVHEGSLANNGGFPSEHMSFLRSLGIQCNFPQFNARLMPKN